MFCVSAFEDGAICKENRASKQIFPQSKKKRERAKEASWRRWHPNKLTER